MLRYVLALRNCAIWCDVIPSCWAQKAPISSRQQVGFGLPSQPIIQQFATSECLVSTTKFPNYIPVSWQKFLKFPSAYTYKFCWTGRPLSRQGNTKVYIFLPSIASNPGRSYVDICIDKGRMCDMKMVLNFVIYIILGFQDILRISSLHGPALNVRFIYCLYEWDSQV